MTNTEVKINVSEPKPSSNPNGSEDFARRKKYVPFGNKIIGVKDLENNILNIRYPTYKSLREWRRTPISPLFSAIVQGYLSVPNLTAENFKINPAEKNLSEEERQLMGIFLKRVCVRNSVSMADRRKNVQDRKRELKILLGMRAAGNNNPEMVADILKKAKYLKTQGHLSRQMLADILESLANPEAETETP